MKGCNQLRTEPGLSLTLELPPKSLSWCKQLLQSYCEPYFTHDCTLFRRNVHKMLQAFQTVPNKSESKELQFISPSLFTLHSVQTDGH